LETVNLRHVFIGDLPIPTLYYRVEDASVAWRVVDEEAVLLHADSSEYFGLNLTGTLLWTRLAEQAMTSSQLAAWARKIFPDAPAAIEEAISTFLDRLLEHKLLETSESASTTPAPQPRAAEGKVPPWETPAVQRFGELEKLILSGE
jgi:hypothetical protein